MVAEGLGRLVGVGKVRRYRGFRPRKVAFRRPGMALLIGLILVGGLAAFLSLELSLRGTFAELAKAQASWALNEAIHRAVLEQVAADVSYSDLVKVEKNDQGVMLLQANTARVMQVTSEATLKIQKALSEIKERKLGIPLGQILGSDLLAAYGPKITFTVIPIGTVRTGLTDSFTSAGINQTRHRIFLQVDAWAEILVPLLKTEVEIQTTVPLADAVIVGPVPDMVFGPWPGAGAPGVPSGSSSPAPPTSPAPSASPAPSTPSDSSASSLPPSTAPAPPVQEQPAK